MVSQAEKEIRSKVRELVDGNLPLRNFQSRFVPTSWNLEELDPAADELASEIELRLAEYSRGHWTEDELKNLLARFVEQVTQSN